MRATAFVSYYLSRLALIALIFGLAGCASMSKDECLTANWNEVGLRDGQNGEARGMFSSHVKACKEAGVIPDRNQYMAGYERGIVRFCVPSTGLEVGRRGRSYETGTCSLAQEPAFLAAYRRGYDVYRAQQEVDRVNSRMRDTQNRLNSTKDEARRKELRRDLRDMDRDIWMARERLRDAERWAYQ
ncbi:MAG: DUF2799 domain-containing protein [Herbaspirillum sp.]